MSVCTLSAGGVRLTQPPVSARRSPVRLPQDGHYPVRTRKTLLINAFAEPDQRSGGTASR
jgi:hypothetical protein